MSSTTDYYTYTPPFPLRAGFWRRAIALLLDFVIVCLPFQIAAAALFISTDGKIHETMGLRVLQCGMLPETDLTRFKNSELLPSPPEGANYARRCRISLFGLPTADLLVIGRHTVEQSGPGKLVKDFFVTYPLTPNGQVTRSHNIDWLAQLALITYWLSLQTLFGQTLAMRFMKTRLVVLQRRDARGVPFWRVFLRNFLAALPMFPMAMVLQVGVLFGDVSSQLLLAAGGIAIGCGLWVFYDLVWKRDPYFDRYAGTAVIHTLQQEQEA
jgi:uncharacterized RDD family membrane protein YckC